MSWISNGLDYIYGNWANGWKEELSLGGLAKNDLSRFFESEQQKSALRGAEIEGVLSGIPVVGNVIKGIEGVNQMEDLYSQTGRVPAYPGLQNLGSSSLGAVGKSIPGLSRKIESGVHDLFEHYAGSTDETEKELHEKGIMKYGDEI